MRLLADTICGNKNIIDTGVNSPNGRPVRRKIYKMLKSGWSRQICLGHGRLVKKELQIYTVGSKYVTVLIVLQVRSRLVRSTFWLRLHLPKFKSIGVEIFLSMKADWRKIEVSPQNIQELFITGATVYLDASRSQNWRQGIFV